MVQEVVVNGVTNVVNSGLVVEHDIVWKTTLGVATCTGSDGATTCGAHNADADTCTSTDGGTTPRNGADLNVCVFATNLVLAAPIAAGTTVMQNGKRGQLTVELVNGATNIQITSEQGVVFTTTESIQVRFCLFVCFVCLFYSFVMEHVHL